MIFVMDSRIADILNMTSWRMDTPQIFGAFHITASLLAAALAVLAAGCFARRSTAKNNVQRILFCTGWMLVILEAYKQCFLYCIVNEGAFDIWF